MRDSTAKLAELVTLAPRVDMTLLRILAGPLADEDTPVGTLLNISDALLDGALVAKLDGRLRDAVQIAALADVVQREAERPRPGFH